MINYYTPNDEVVNRNDVNTQASTERVDIPTREEEQALLAYEEHFRQDELASFLRVAKAKKQAQDARDDAMNSALSNGFTIDESSDRNMRWEHLNA